MRKNRTIEMVKLVKEIYNREGDVRQKIALLINTRRNEKSKLIQNACNKYLDKLYQEKYIMLGASA